MKGIGGIQGRPGRFILAALSVMLGVAFMSGAFLAHSSITTTMSGVYDVLTGADVYVQPKGTSVADILLKSTSQHGYLDSATGTQAGVPQSNGTFQGYIGPVILMDEDGNEISSGLAPSIGIPADPNEVESGRVVEGTLPASINEIALEQNTANKAGFKVGDLVQVLASGSTLDVTVSGIVSYDTDLDGAVVVIFYGIAARAIYSTSGMIPFIGVKATDGMTPDGLRTAVESAVTDPNAEVVLGSDVRAQAMSAVTQSMRLIDICLIVVGCAMMLIAGFLVINIFGGAERARAQEIATFKEMGATTSDLMKPVVKQGFVVGLIGSVVGLVAGMALFESARWILNRMGDAVVLSVSWPYQVITFAVGLIVSMVCAWLGAHHVASRKLIDWVKGVQAPTGYGIVRIIVGVIFLAAGAAGVMAGHNQSNTLWIIGLGVLGVLLGIVLVGPILVSVLSWLFSYLLRLFSALPASLAKANLVRGPRRAANVAGVFIVTMALATATLVLTSSASASASSTLDKEVSADLVVQSTGGNGIIPDLAVAKVRQVPNVQVYTFGQASITMDDDPDAKIWFGPAETFTILSNETVEQGNPDDFATGVAVTKAFADSHNLAIGNTINFTIAKTTPYEVNVSLPIAVIIDSDLYKDMMVSYSWLIQQMQGHIRSQLMPVTLMFASASDASQADSIHDPIVAAVEPFKTISVQYKDDFVSAADSQAGEARFFAYALVALCVILAILALVNTSDKAGSERIRETEVLRAVGVSRSQIRTTIVFESVLTCIAGSLVGIVTGVGLAYLGRSVLPLGVTTLTIPWLWLVGLFALAILVGLIAPLGPARRAAKAAA